MSHGQTHLALLKALAHADDRDYPLLKKGVHLGVYEQIVLAVILAALGVADDAVPDSGIVELRRGDLARVRTLIEL